MTRSPTALDFDTPVTVTVPHTQAGHQPDCPRGVADLRDSIIARGPARPGRAIHSSDIAEVASRG
jgi:hypothetical protein